MADLPQPNEPFEWVQATAGPALACRPLLPVAAHVFTTRNWPPGAAAAGTEDEALWGGVAEALGVPLSRLARVKQVHGRAVVGAGDTLGSRLEADIIVSADADVGLVVQAADCVPLLLADRGTGAVAAAHAGWRGLAQNVPAAAVTALARLAGGHPSDFIAAIGPSIGACCYEVGPDVRQRFVEGRFAAAQLSRWFRATAVADPRNPALVRPAPPGRPDRLFFDAWGAAREQLETAGVPSDQIHVAQLCTASHPAALCSYRRDGAAAGRIGGAIRSRPRP